MAVGESEYDGEYEAEPGMTTTRMTMTQRSIRSYRSRRRWRTRTG